MKLIKNGVWRMFSVSAISAYVVTCMCSFSIDVLIRTLSDECSLEVFKLTIKVCHSAQDILPLPIPAKRKKKNRVISHQNNFFLKNNFYPLTATKMMTLKCPFVIKQMLFWHKCIRGKTFKCKVEEVFIQTSVHHWK